MSDIDQLQQILALAQPRVDLTPIYDGVAAQLRAQSSEKTAQAISVLKAEGVDPQMYLPVSREYTRSLQMQSRLRIAEADAEQARRHKDELHAIEVKALTDSANRLAAPRSVQSIPALQD